MEHLNSPQSQLLGDRISPGLVPSELTSLEHWRALRHLGTGSSAKVWLLESLSTDQKIACKLPRSTEDQLTLSQEAELARSLSHENLIRPMSSDLLAGLESLERVGATFWEFLPAGSLGTLVASGRQLTVAQTVTVLLPMIQVGQYLHEYQIVHGDLSPANILFDLEARPVLIDLGAVRATAHAFYRTGTPGFAAPELDSRVWPDGLGAAADVYALAAVGWFCLTGTRPGNPSARVPLVTLRPEIEPEIAAILEACLVEDPALRPALGHLLMAVAAWAEPEPVDLFASAGAEYELFLPTRKPSVQRRKRRLGRRRRGASLKANRSAVNHGDALDATGRFSRRRLVAGMGALVLVAGVVITGLQVGQVPLQSVGSDEVVPQSEDFQAVVDTIAKARTQAWATADVSAVADYAAEDSGVFEDDVTVLASLAETGMSLDGIRMRAVVLSAQHSQQIAVVKVEWRTDTYVQRDQAQQVVDEMPARVELLVLRLVETPEGWRISSVTSG